MDIHHDNLMNMGQLPPLPRANVSVYSLLSPLSSTDFTIYTPVIGTLSYTVY